MYLRRSAFLALARRKLAASYRVESHERMKGDNQKAVDAIRRALHIYFLIISVKFHELTENVRVGYPILLCNAVISAYYVRIG
jgi:hypothetical protein